MKEPLPYSSATPPNYRDAAWLDTSAWPHVLKFWNEALERWVPSDDIVLRLQDALCGTRSLSDEVLLACGWRLVDQRDARETRWLDPFGIAYDEWSDPHTRSIAPIRHRPSPTENWSGAFSIMPARCYWLGGAGRLTPKEPLHGFEIMRPSIGVHDVLGVGQHENGPLALCLAILDARKDPLCPR